MSAFLLWAALLLLLTLVFMLPPLLRHAARGNDAGTESSGGDASLAVLRDHLRELDADLERGLISPQAHAAARGELARRVAEDTGMPHGAPAGRPLRWSPPLVALLVPVGAAALYLVLGSPDAIVSADRQAHAPQSMEHAVAGLAQRLEAAPGDIEGWHMLARSYNAMERYEDAVRAYARLAALRPQDADVLADYADTLAMLNNRSLQGEPERLVLRALQADPGHPKAIALAGTAAFERQDYRQAVAHWERIMHLVPEDSELAASTAASIAEARRLMAGGGPAPRAAKAVTGTVDIDPALRARVPADATVFIYAKAAQGPSAPLAVVRRQVRDLPFAFRLDDTAAMAQGLKLSGHDRVVVGARISTSGNALDRQAGFEAVSEPVANDASGLRLTIAGTK